MYLVSSYKFLKYSSQVVFSLGPRFSSNENFTQPHLQNSPIQRTALAPYAARIITLLRLACGSQHMPLNMSDEPIRVATSKARFNAASRAAFGKEPYEWQSSWGSLRILSIFKDKATLIVRPTGGGKSLVRDVCSVIVGGVSLIIMPLLYLGADQLLFPQNGHDGNDGVDRKKQQSNSVFSTE